MSRNESGSAHVIVIGVLVVALTGTMGFIFWQNFINKPDAAKSTTEVTKADVAPKPSLKKYCAPLEKLCFDYPSTWTVKADSVDAETEGMAERVVVSDESGHKWLQLETGMGGLGGMCSNEDNSYSKVMNTHTTDIQGAYLINKGAEKYVADTVYAVSWMTYDGTNKDWTIDMRLNDSKAVSSVGRLDPCDIGIAVINGKNAKAFGGDSAGGVAFRYYTGSDKDRTYATEAEASAVLNSPDAVKAYSILQSARYE